MYDIIAKKRDGGKLTREEIRFAVKGFTSGAIPDYQMAAFLMAVYFRDMDDGETADLTDCMARSGDMADLSGIEGITADKHSTGGVGDKTTLVVAPVVAACGVKIAKMSGKGLGFSGGTVDKLESIKGFRTWLGREEFIKTVNEVGLSLIGQTGNLAPADKKIYALRDVTATVEKIPLIASSVMSKKLAAGADCILLDVKAGSGAFMKNIDDALKLAQTMVGIGERAGRRTAALITNMDCPLGAAVGNSLEVIEAVQTLKGRGPRDLREICAELATGMLVLAGRGGREECIKLAEKALDSGAAFEKFRALVAAQGGDTSLIDDTEKFEKAGYISEITAQEDGYVFSMDAEKIGLLSVQLGAGRETKDSDIDHSAGLIINFKIGDKVKKGDVLAQLHTNRKNALAGAARLYRDAVAISKAPPKRTPLILARVEKDAVEKFY